MAIADRRFHLRLFKFGLVEAKPMGERANARHAARPEIMAVITSHLMLLVLCR